MSPVRVSFTSELPVGETAKTSILHPKEAAELATALDWGRTEADRLAGLVNKSGFYITRVEIHLPRPEEHSLIVFVSGEEGRGP